MADPASAERAVLRVCRSGLDVTDLQHHLLAALRAAMTVDAAFFATADPETLLFTGAHTEDPLSAMTSRFLDNELGGRDVNTFTGLVRAPGHVRSLDTATRRDRMTSPRPTSRTPYARPSSCTLAARSTGTGPESSSSTSRWISCPAPRRPTPCFR